MRQGKKKLMFGGAGLQQAGPLQSSAYQAAGAVPFWGQLAQANMQMSSAIKGDGTNTTRSVAAQLTDPVSTTLSAIEKGDAKLALKSLVPVWGGIAAAKEARKEQAILDNQLDAVNTAGFMGNATGLKFGGKLGKKLGLVGGGTLTPAGPEAVEVQANNPAATDSVELNQAFVDHGEIIDKNTRVFSDSLIDPETGKTIAKVAKRLEKMKSPDPRFGQYNEMIDMKLSTLFQKQEGLKARFLASQRDEAKKGNATEEAIQSTLGYKAQRELKKAGLKLGGEMDPWEPGAYVPNNNEALGNIWEPGYYVPGETVQPYTPLQDHTADNKKFNWQQLGTMAATFGSNIANQAIISKLAGPPRPMGESAVNLKRVSPAAQLNEINSGFRSAQEVANRNIAQSSNLISATGSLMAKRLQAANQAIGQNNALNAQIGNQEAVMNTGLRARNIERLNNFENEKVAFKNKKKQLTSQNLANVSEKVLMLGREKNMKDRDMFQMDLLSKAYGDSRVWDRNFASAFEDYMRKKGLIR